MPGKSQGQRNLAGYSPWGCKESDVTVGLVHTHTHTHVKLAIVKYSQGAITNILEIIKNLENEN